MNTLLKINQTIISTYIDMVRAVGYNKDTEELNILGVLLVVVGWVLGTIFYAALILIPVLAGFFFVLDTFMFESNTTNTLWFQIKCNLLTWLPFIDRCY